MANNTPRNPDLNQQGGTPPDPLKTAPMQTPTPAAAETVEAKAPEIVGPSLEDMHREIAALELEAKTLQLEELRITTAEARAKRESKKRENAQRQAQLKMERDNLEVLQARCAHLQGGGGDGSDILDGGGDQSKPCLYVTRMLDGKTYLFQCPHCRLKFLGPPHPNLKKTDPERFEFEMEKTADLMKRAKRNIAGADAAFIKSPTFEFSRDGINFLPERV